MDIGSLVNQGLIGMQSSQASMVKSAQQIASAAAPSTPDLPALDIVEPLVNLNVQSKLFDSSAKVVKAADEAIGTLLDIKA